MDKESDPLKCLVCEESYNRKKHCPRILNCSHTFCTFCIGQLISNGTRNCPVCRQRFNARSKKDIAVNRALLDIIDMLTKKKNCKKSEGAFSEVWQKSFSKDLKEGIFAVCTKEKALTGDIMKMKQELKANFKEKSDKIDDKLIPALSEISRKFSAYIKKIDEDHQFLETRYGTLTKEEEELSRIDSNVKVSKSFESFDSYVVTIGEIEKRLEALRLELKDFIAKDESEHSMMIKELKDAERKLTVIEDIPSHENKEKENTRLTTGAMLQQMRPRPAQSERWVPEERLDPYSRLFVCRRRGIERNRGINNYQDIFKRHGIDAADDHDHDDDDDDDDEDDDNDIYDDDNDFPRNVGDILDDYVYSD